MHASAIFDNEGASSLDEYLRVNETEADAYRLLYSDTVAASTQKGRHSGHPQN